MHRARLVASNVVLVAALALAACGDDGGAGAGGASAASSTGTSSSTTSAAGSTADGGATGSGGDGGEGGAGEGAAGQGGDGHGGDGGAAGQGGGGAAAQGGGGAGQGGSGGEDQGSGGGGGASALPGCDAYRDTYLDVADALDCPNPQVASPAYCDQFVDDPCLVERTAYWECAEPLFSPQACTCLEYQGQMLLRCGDICAAETDALTACSIDG